MKETKIKWSGRLKRETVKLIKRTAKAQKVSEADVVDGWSADLVELAKRPRILIPSGFPKETTP